MKRILKLITFLALAVTLAAADLRFSDFTPETSPLSTDFVAGFRTAGVAGGNRRYSLDTLNTYFQGRISGLGDAQITSLSWSKITSAPTFAPAATTLSGYGITDAVGFTAQTRTAAEQAQARANVGVKGLFPTKKLNTYSAPRGMHPAAASANYAFLFETTAEQAFTAVRVIFFNYGSAAMTWDNTAIAVAGDATANGTALTWLPVYFNQPSYLGQGRTLVTSGTTASVTVPAGVGSSNVINNIPGIVASDWVSLTSIARTDGGTLPLVQLRTWTSAGGTALNGSAGVVALNAGASGRITRGAIYADSTGVFITAPTGHSMVPGEAAGGWTAPVILEFKTATRTVTHLVCGDSLERGQSSSSSTVAAPHELRAMAALSTAGVPVQGVNMAISGSGSAYNHERLERFLDLLQPSIALFPAGSSNDVTDDIGHNYTTLMRAVAMARRYDTIPVVATIPPSGKSGATEAARVAMNTWVKSMAALGAFTVFDKDAVLRDPGNASSILAAYDSGDATHPNEAGWAALGSAYQTLLNSLIPTVQ